MVDFSEYQELAETGYASKPVTPPEQEFFHAVYIGGQDRTNHQNIVEKAGKLHIRGVEYNLDEVNFIITHVKEVLAKTMQSPRGETVECFSFKEGPGPWKGTSGHPCGSTSAERAASSYCSSCRSQLIVSGILTDSNGVPRKNEEGKPIFVFLRAKGMKYGNVSSYLSDISQQEFEPFFTPVTEASKNAEKAFVNNKRVVTNVTIGKESSKYGPKDVFVLTSSVTLANDIVKNILDISKKTKDKFVEKFDWSKNKATSTGYVPSEDQKFSDSNNNNNEKAESSPSKSDFSLDDVVF